MSTGGELDPLWGEFSQSNPRIGAQKFLKKNYAKNYHFEAQTVNKVVLLLCVTREIALAGRDSVSLTLLRMSL